jgi:hypothetical protein
MHPKLETIGFLPTSDPFNRKVCACFTRAGFARIKLELNVDRSLLSFSMEHGTHPRLKTHRQAHATVRLLLRKAGVDFARSDELFVKLSGDAIEGAFTPPDWVPNPPDRLASLSLRLLSWAAVTSLHAETA